MRPRGEERMALSMAAAEFGRGGAHFKALAHRSLVGADVARITLRNMAVAGELQIVGQASLPGVSRPVNLYAVPLPEHDAAELADVVRCWADFR
jgi:hypothetical protein